MNKEEPFRDQAERLRQKIEKIKDGAEIESKLPSRTNVHRNKKNKTKLKLRFPVIRLLALFFILLPVVFFSIYSYLGEKKFNTSEKVNTQNGGYEEINLAASNEDNQSEPANSLVNEDSKEDPPGDTNIGKDQDDKSTLESDTMQEKNDLPSTDKDQISSTNQDADSTEGMVYHTVQSNETLFRIAMNYYHSQEGIKIIQDANQLQGNEIKVGQVLKIPK